MARRRAKVYDANGNEVRNEHGDCVFANYDPDDTVRLCKEGGQYGRPEFRGWRYCSRAKHCAAAADFRDGDRDDFLVCKTHNQQSWKSKQRAKNKQHLVRTTKPTPRGPRTPKKGKATKTGRVEKAITPKKTKVTAGTTPKKAKKTKKEKSELFVSSEEDSNDEDGEYETDVDMPTAHIPRRYPGPDDDASGGGGMGGGMSGQLIAV